ncbi:lipoprotein insertase outer membrane protein LolB [Acinetobacter ursingii]|uniref:lipoprotein insertase outer membrane protein LolB n=1 Tax=Acinetobacter ursingii TaxID=108980 RepID=UPI00124F7720|nr:lipoprotein insertase outer membrane protein LolB [Acinetobacter ursingii]MCU4382666.1 lipoprotein insertase outer membrane protein LolB [Acinetobacter ursingii]MDU4392878.1 lipoprotein insertase outer membrane protein LolB [Acinetobacter ursingii]
MNTLSQTCIALCCSSALFLTGCQHFTQPQLPKNTQESENQFNLQGKIGVRTPQQTGSAFFTWAQQQQNFDIELTGILGMGKTQIQGKNGKVTLNSAKTGLITASSPEELLERATGWQAPITHIISWVQARPATTQAQTTQDSNGRINHIQEDGWNVDLSYDSEQKLPNKLILKQSLEDNKENRITMVIQNR